VVFDQEDVEAGIGHLRGNSIWHYHEGTKARRILRVSFDGGSRLNALESRDTFGGGQGELEMECGSFAGFAVDADAAAEVVYEAFDQGEADAVAFVVAGLEGLEEALAHLGGDAGAGVGDVDGAEALGGILADAEGDVAACAHGLL